MLQSINTQINEDTELAVSEDKKSSKLGGTLILLVAMCALLAGLFPSPAEAQQNSWSIENERRYDGCIFKVRLGQNSIKDGHSFAQTTPRYSWQHPSGDGYCEQSVKVRLSYYKSGKAWMTPYQYGHRWTTVKRYHDTTPRNSTGCLFGENTKRWGCYTLWA